MIRDVHHVGIAVSDLEAAYALYRDALGLALVKEGEAAARGARVAVLDAGGRYIELVQPATGSSPFAAFIEEHGEGLHHVALWSDDCLADVARLRELGVPLADREPREGFTGRLSFLAPEAFDGALLEVVEPENALAGETMSTETLVTRIDHVVLRVPHVATVSQRLRDWFGIETKRTFERAETAFAFMRPGEVVIEVIGPVDPPAEPRPAVIAGLCFECKDIDALAAGLKAKGFPIGDPHPALQGGRIVSIHPSGASGVPLAFIDFAGSPGPPPR
jgi:methylmalonyl-CoA/ethylmalonyl-CoA epimerase